MNRLLDLLRQVGRWIRPLHSPFPRRPAYAPIHGPYGHESPAQGLSRKL